MRAMIDQGLSRGVRGTGRNGGKSPFSKYIKGKNTETVFTRGDNVRGTCRGKTELRKEGLV